MGKGPDEADALGGFKGVKVGVAVGVEAKGEEELAPDPESARVLCLGVSL
jgi:hypothetical protein